MPESEVTISLIGLMGVLVTAYLGYKGKIAERKLARNELMAETEALDFSKFLTGWDGFNREILDLMRDTPIDRFLILRAWNGAQSPRWTTALYQMRGGDQKPVSYIHVELDADYVERLRHAVLNGEMKMTVDDSSDSLIHRIYRAENIKSAIWFHVQSKNFGRKSKAITYCSFASHDIDTIDDVTALHCRRIISRLIALSEGFKE